jgi:hypothetical protein
LEKIKSSSGSKEVTKAVSVKIKVAADDTIAECYSYEDAAASAATEASCIQIGGTYDMATKSCALAQDCSTANPNKPIPARCVTVLESQVSALATQLTSLEKVAEDLSRELASVKRDELHHFRLWPLLREQLRDQRKFL